MSYDPLSVLLHVPDLIHSTGLIPHKKHIQEIPGHEDRGGSVSGCHKVPHQRCLTFLFISLQVSANGNVLRSEIVGSIKMRVFLSGMPELRLGLNDKVLFDNTGRECYHHSHHRCYLES